MVLKMYICVMINLFEFPAFAHGLTHLQQEMRVFFISADFSYSIYFLSRNIAALVVYGLLI